MVGGPSHYQALQQLRSDRPKACAPQPRAKPYSSSSFQGEPAQATIRRSRLLFCFLATHIFYTSKSSRNSQFHVLIHHRPDFPAAPLSTPASREAQPPSETVHVVLPRRKAGDLDAPERDAVFVTPEVLQSLFHLPLAVASQKLVSILDRKHPVSPDVFCIVVNGYVR